MTRKSILAAVAAASFLVLACTDAEHAPTGLRAPRPHLELSAPPLAQIQDQIDRLFPSGGLRTAASAHLTNITADLDKQKTENARKKTFALVNFLRQKQGTGQLLDPNGPTVAPTTSDAADALVSSLYLYVGLTPAGTPPTNVAVDAAIAVVGPSGGTVATGGAAPNGAVVFPAGALAQYVTVTIERLPNPDGTNYPEVPYRKYPIAFDIKTVPAVTLPNDQRATVAVCTIEPGTEASGIPPRPSRLRLAHITAAAPGGFELLPPGTASEPLPSSCEDARLAATDPRPTGALRLALWQARRLGDRAIAAVTPTTAYAGHGGLLGQTTTFSPFVPADPDAPASVTVTPGAATIPQGGTQSFAAVALNAAGADVTEGSVPAAWISSNPAVATVDATTGLVTGVAAGTATITATIESASGTATVTVTSGPPGITSLTLSTTTMQIEGSVPYSFVLDNPGAGRDNVVLQGYIDQGQGASAVQRVTGGIRVQCDAGNGVLPHGTCSMSYTALVSNTQTMGNGTLVPGPATFTLELYQEVPNGRTVLDTRSVPVTLVAPPPPTITSLTLSTSTLTIGGTSATYNATIANPGADASGVALQGWIIQGDAARLASDVAVRCGPSAGVLPAGTCNASFGLIASNTTRGNGTLVPGSATFMLAAVQSAGELQTTLATRSLPINLVAAAPPVGFGLTMNNGASYILTGPTGTTSWASTDPNGVSVEPVAGSVPSALVTTNFAGRAVTVTASDASGRALMQWQVNTGNNATPLDVGPSGYIIAAWVPTLSGISPSAYRFHAQLCKTIGLTYDECPASDWIEHMTGVGGSPAQTMLQFPAGYAGRWEVFYLGDQGQELGRYGWHGFSRAP